MYLLYLRSNYGLCVILLSISKYIHYTNVLCIEICDIDERLFLCLHFIKTTFKWSKNIRHRPVWFSVWFIMEMCTESPKMQIEYTTFIVIWEYGGNLETYMVLLKKKLHIWLYGNKMLSHCISLVHFSFRIIERIKCQEFIVKIQKSTWF